MTMGVPNRDFGNDGAEIGKDKASDGHLNFVLVTHVSDFWERSEQKSGFGRKTKPGVTLGEILVTFS
jgi:hypothetical protein